MKLEAPISLALLVALCGLVGLEGQRNAALRAQAAISDKVLYQRLAKLKTKPQIVDVREDLSEYDDEHVPGALPFPGCDPSKVPAAAKDRIFAYVPTIVVSADGDPATFERCRAHFKQAQNLAGGMAAWSDDNIPAESGEYVAQKASAGGGCL